MWARQGGSGKAGIHRMDQQEEKLVDHRLVGGSLGMQPVLACTRGIRGRQTAMGWTRESTGGLVALGWTRGSTGRQAATKG